MGYPEPCSNSSEKYSTVPIISLDYYLSSFVQDTIVDILKINIGGLERDILKSSEMIKVQSICGETVLEPEHIPAFKAEMAAKGFVNAHVIANTEEDNKIFFIFSKNEIEKYYNL